MGSVVGDCGGCGDFCWVYWWWKIVWVFFVGVVGFWGFYLRWVVLCVFVVDWL